MKNLLLITALAASGALYITSPGVQKEAPLAQIEVGLISTAKAQDVKPVATVAQLEVTSGAQLKAPPAGIVDPKNQDKPISDSAFLDWLLKSVGGLKGLGAAGVASFVAQLLAGFLMTDMFAGLIGMKKPIADWMGKWKLTLVSVLIFTSGILMFLGTGLDWKAASTHSTTLVAFNIMINQFLKQFRETKAESDAKKAALA